MPASHQRPENFHRLGSGGVSAITTGPRQANSAAATMAANSSGVGLGAVAIAGNATGQVLLLARGPACSLSAIACEHDTNGGVAPYRSQKFPQRWGVHGFRPWALAPRYCPRASLGLHVGDSYWLRKQGDEMNTFFRRWLAVVMVCAGVLAHSQPASAATAHTFSTLLKVSTGTALGYPVLSPTQSGQLTVTSTMACADLGVGASTPASAGACTVSFTGPYRNATCTNVTGAGRGSVSTPVGRYDFAATFQVAASTLTFEGTAARGSEVGTIVGSGALTINPSSSASCYNVTATEYEYAGTFTFALS